MPNSSNNSPDWQAIVESVSSHAQSWYSILKGVNSKNTNPPAGGVVGGSSTVGGKNQSAEPSAPGSFLSSGPGSFFSKYMPYIVGFFLLKKFVWKR